MSTTVYDDYWGKLRATSKYHPGNRFRYYLISKYLCKFTENKPVKSIIDIGCGDAELLRHLAKKFPNAKLAGIDVSDEQIEENKKIFSSMQFWQCDCGSAKLTDFINERFDIVLSSEVIEHVENDDLFIKNLCELIAPGGYVLITTQSGKMYKMDTQILGHLRAYSGKDIVKKLTDNSVEVKASLNSGFPILSLQKIAVDMFFDKVVRSMTADSEPSFFAKLIMELMFYGMVVCQKIPYGPQLLLIGRKGV